MTQQQVESALRALGRGELPFTRGQRYRIAVVFAGYLGLTDPAELDRYYAACLEDDVPAAPDGAA